MRQIAKFAAAGVAVAGVVGAAPAASAPCGPHRGMAAELETRFAEHPVGHGLIATGRVLRLFVSERGSWTVLIVLPDGRACAAAFGEGWEAVAPPDRKPGAGA